MSSITHQLNLQGTVFCLPEANLLYSPYFKALLQSGLAIDRNKAGQILLDLDPQHFQQYANFLLGQDFTLTEEIVALFDYLGHSNDLDYPLDYWAVKLHDNWVRDHFYSLKLYQDPLFDLVPLPIKVERQLPVPLPQGWYLAGGAALWLAGYIEQLADLDLFTCLSKEEAEQSLAYLQRTKEDLIKQRPDLSQAFHQEFQGYYDKIDLSVNSVTAYQIVKEVPLKDRYRYYDQRKLYLKKVQHILRLYRSPSETVHGFDLDCVGIVYLPPGYQVGNRVSEGELWATKRTAYSLQQKVNWFDPDRASPSYVYRLLKYRNRGFRIELPLISQAETKPEEVIKYFHVIDQEYRDQREDEVEINDYDGIVTAVIDQATNQVGQIVRSADELKISLKLALNHDKAYRQFSYIASDFGEIINDPASLLILARFYNFYSVRGAVKVSDYTTGNLDFETWLKREGLDSLHYYERCRIKSRYRQERWPNKKEFKFSLAKLNWREQEPMSQLTSTFHPEPITDLKEWYRQSPFYQQLE